MYVGGGWSGGGFNPSSTNPMTKQCPPDHQSGMVLLKNTPLIQTVGCVAKTSSCLHKGHRPGL